MALIGVIDIAMKANVGPFVAGMGSASKSLRSFVSGTGSTLAGGLAKMESGLGKAGSQVKGLTGNLLGLNSVSGLVAAGLGALGVASASSLVSSSLGAIDATGDLAEKLGVTGGALSAFQHAVKLTGGPVEQLPEILGKLNATLGTAARSGGPAAEAIKRLGLSASDLAKAGPIEATKQIADRLSKIENPAARASAAVAIFGEQGAKLAGTFKAGSAGIAALEAEAVGLGLALADADYAKVAAANDALDRSAAAVTGIGNSLAVGLAPYIEAAATKFTELAASGGGFGTTVLAGIEMVAGGIGKAADVLSVLRAGFLGGQAVVTGYASVVVSAYDSIARGIVSVINLIPGVEVAYSDTLKTVSDDLGKLAGEQSAAFQEAWAAPPPSAGIKTFFDDIRNSADASAAAIVGTGTAVQGLGDDLSDTASKVAALESKLSEQIATFGMTTAEVDAYKLAQAGASDADLARVDALAQELKGMEEAKKAQDDMVKEAQRVRDAIATPGEKFAEEAAKLRDLFSAGLINPDELARGLAKARADAGGLGAAEYKGAGAFEAGSKEARSAILANRGGGANADTRRTADGVATLVREQQANNQAMNRAVGHLAALAGAPLVDIG